MRSNSAHTFTKYALFTSALLLLGAGGAAAQISLTAAPTTASLPDGTSVPMWGYTCGPAISGSTSTCKAANPNAGGNWSPVIITVQTGTDLQINLTNHLSFANGTTVPTSLTIVGQLGGGLGKPTSVASPSHPDQSVTWPVAGTAGSGATFSPPAQGNRVQSFGTEVAAGPTPTTLTWTSPRAGTYLLESGTHPSIQGTMGLYGIVIVTSAPTVDPVTGNRISPGTAYPNVAPPITYDADVALIFSEIDPVQNNAVSAAVNTAGFSETAVWSGQPGGCGNPTSGTYQTCYPPAVNYKPLYYLINGVAFNKTNASASLFPANPTGVGSALVRMVNAGSRMHVPSIVGAQTMSGVGGFSLIAEDGNPLPGLPRVQSEVFMSAGKTYDVMINMPPTGSPALPIYDRELSLSANAIGRDAGMLAYISINGGGLPAAPALKAAQANPDTYASVVPGETLTISDPSKGLIANDINVYGVALQSPQPPGTLTQGSVSLNANGTFTYIPNPGWTGSDTFVYQANGSGPTAVVTLGAAPIEANTKIAMSDSSFTSRTATYLRVPSPGVLAVDKDGAGYPLTVDLTSLKNIPSNLTLTMDAQGGFVASIPASSGASAQTFVFQYNAKNAQGTVSATSANVTLTFPAPSNLAVSVLDGTNPKTAAPITDYRWIIEEDRTFYVDPNNTTNTATGFVPTYGTNFHTSNMPMIAQGCTGPLSCGSGQTVFDPTSGQHVAAVCDLGNGKCRPDTSGNGQMSVDPRQVVLDPTKRYYISVLPGDAANAFQNGTVSASSCTPATCGHGMGGAPISAGQTSVNVLVQPNPYPTGELSVFVFEDDFPLNGEQDAGGGVDVLATNEPGLGGFQIHLWDAMGGNGDFTGQMTYDMFNQPLTNGLDGTIDPVTNFNACPIAKAATAVATNGGAPVPNVSGITGMIVTCPKYESDGKTPSPFAGQALIKNLMPGRFGVIATPAADRIARGEEWHQTNTLDGQKAHDSFIRIGEPSYFQEFGPASYHVAIGFASPKIIQSRLAGVCAGTDAFVSLPPNSSCNNTVKGTVTTERYSRTPDERLYSSGTHDSFYWTQCYVSLGDPDGEDFAFTKCDDKGKFTFTGIPPGDWRVSVFDQWNDMLVDGLSTPVRAGGGLTTDIGDIAENQWQANMYTRTFIDDDKNGVSNTGEGGIPLIPVAVRYRDGSLANGLSTDFTGTANFNETFPLFNWYVVESDTTRYKNTGTHVVYDAGGPADGSLACGQAGYPKCGTSTIGKFLANTYENTPLPANLQVPGSVYCGGADCGGHSIQSGPGSSDTGTISTGRIDSPWTGGVEGWQGFAGQNNFIEFGKEPYAAGENGGIKGHVVYASTRPFDDPQLLVQTQWEPLVPHVKINLYQEGTAPDGTLSLTLVDTTQTSSFDDYAQGFRADGVTPNMNCPGQSTADLFYFTLYNQPNYLNTYDAAHGGPPAPSMPNNSQFKCYDGMHNWNQVQPVPYDGMYKFPSVIATDASGKPTGTNCTICKADPVAAPDLYSGIPMLPPGKYVVEVVPPSGFEIVKEEDKNILIGDNYIAPVTQEFGGLGNIFILPDQAEVASAYNPNNAQNPTTGFGTTPINGMVPGFVPEPVWPCVGESRIVPDYISLFPQSQQEAPFAGATRNLCDRKEVTLNDQMGAIAKFYIYTSTHIAAKYTGIITDDFTSEFDPFSPQFGEKFSPPDMPISIKDWTGAEVSRAYSDHWGNYDGMTYSTWEVNPPNPTGYAPTMMVMCMNDPGSGITPDPLYNSAYSNFCYELPFMPGQTAYLDTPVVPTSAFSAGYNHPDCAYPDATPAISEVDGDLGAGTGPWVSALGKTLTITALGNQIVQNYGYSGPAATTTPFNQKTVTRHYGFGGASGTVTIGGVNAPITPNGWTDTSITVTLPTTGIPACAMQQQAQYGGSTAYCGQLEVTTAAGKKSIDTVTVTIGGKPPTYVSGTVPLSQSGSGSIQKAIDAASPGDLIMVPPGVYKEMLIMWKPVRLQGVGAASTVIDANTHPAGKLDPWRQQMVCLFGLALNGTPVSAKNPFNPGAGATCPANMAGKPENPQIDRLPLEGIVGWDTTTNGNLAQLLQEPTLLGAYEGAGITVLSKGVNTHGATGYYGSGNESAFPTGTTVLTNGILDCGLSFPGFTLLPNPYPSNFQCNPSRIDGLTVTDSSQGGGGIFVHAWGHNIEISNNRVYGNIGTLSGGINIGQGESPDAYLAGNASNSLPGSCQTGGYANQQLPYCFDLNVNVHNNSVTSNTSIGDELFAGTPAGAGGVTFCTGADYYKFNYNWICGNQSTGDGGGVAHLGYIWNGDIEHNAIIFNQSTNPTIQSNGGGLIVLGAAPDGMTTAGVECGNTVADADCPPGLPDGTGPNLTINANLLLGNAAESGSGGGLRLQSVNGIDATLFPSQPTLWNTVNVTNNIIANNVAGWDGAGVSMQDALKVNFINNTVMSNDTTASSGVLFNTLGAPLASAPGATNQTQPGSTTTSAPQPAGLVVMPNSSNLNAAFGNQKIVCPTNNFAPGAPLTCAAVSYPYIANDVFWQNRSFYIGVGALDPNYQQNIVTLYNAFTTTKSVSQPQAGTTSANGAGSIITGGTGACTNPASYWEIGVRGDSGPTNHSTTTLTPVYSVLTDAQDYPGLNNTNSNPAVKSQYCNGSRTPPEYASGGYQVPPGISDATVPNPIFNLSPSATVDEGNNWVNISWGPLSQVNPITNTTLGNYGPSSTSSVIGLIPSTAGASYNNAPALDFFNNPRKKNNAVDAGAVQYVGVPLAIGSVTGGPLAFGSVVDTTTSAAQTLTLHNTGTADLTGITVAFTGPFAAAAGGTCGTTLTAAATTCTIKVAFTPTTPGPTTGSVTITANVPVTGSPVSLSGTGVAVLKSATFLPPVWNITQTRNCPGSGFFGQLACALDPSQPFTLTNTGNVPLTGITQGVLGGTAPNPANYTVLTGLSSTCGPAANGQLIAITTLAPGATCVVRVQFKPLTAQAKGLKPATISVSDLAGTQTATLNGMAN